MASTNRPLDESTATLVSPDDHVHAKDLVSTATNASTDISSGTVSDEEPSTPDPRADVPVSVLCGWPHLDDPKGPAAAENLKGWPPVGTPDKGSDFVPGDSNKPDPAKLHPLSKAGTDSTSNDDSVSVQCGWPDGNASKPDPAKLQPDSSGSNDETGPETAAGPEQRREPGTVGPEGQPPWGVKTLAAIAGPEGQPPWGVKKGLGAADLNANAVAGPEGQPPWGVKNLAASAAATGGNESGKSADGAQDASA
ncbi:hypothetical protein MY11210_006038 [Beauveria gryllotalpidicola]